MSKRLLVILRKHRRAFAVSLVCLALLLVSTVALVATQPYAVYANGTKVRNPYAITAGDNQIALVKDKKTAKRVIDSVMDEYTPSGSQIDGIVVDQQLSTSKATLTRGEKPQTVLSEEEATKYIIAKNKTDDPLFCVTVTTEQGSVKSLKKDTEYEDTDKLYEGQTKVKEKGSDGDQVVTVSTVTVNGEKVSSQVVDKTVVNESEKSIVYKGTKELPEGMTADDVLGTGDGASVVSTGLKYVGNPYRYGGTSLTNGIDCSAFTQAIYRKYGISLPRTSSAQRSVGKSVSYSNAKVGDLICYNGHVAIYIGGGKIVHAATRSKGICVSNAKSPGKIVSVRRVLN